MGIEINFASIIVLLLSVLFLINGMFLHKKAVAKKDLTILSTAITRYIFFIVYILYRINLFGMVLLLYLSLCMIVISDIIMLIVYYKSYKYKLELDYKRLEKTLSDLMYKYKIIVDNSPIAMFVYNQKLLIEYVNDSVCKLLGYSKEELIGTHIFKYVYSDQIALITEKVNDRFTNKVLTDRYKLNLIKKDNTLINITIISARTENGHPTVTASILTDEQCKGG
jgi:PAS domain S-box-containing protein